MTRVDVNPEILRWARERSGRSAEWLRQRFPKLDRWERREERPTLKRLEAFAKATYTPFGYLFLKEPPDETLPVPDFRSFAGKPVARPSPNLLDTIYLCQQRQEWYREYATLMGEDRRSFVGSVRRTDPVDEVAERMRHALGFDLEQRRECPTWAEALRLFVEQAEEAGVLVMRSGVVRNDNRRRLDPREFRGFALADDLAPLVFLNAADTRAAQMFTLAHELAHLWLGQSALTDADLESIPKQETEAWCNRVAAELLVPLRDFTEELSRTGELGHELKRLARRFKVSTLVILRRMLDAGRIGRLAFREAYDAEIERPRALPRASGGDFYATHASRVSERFARALVASTLEGQTLYREAYQLLAISKARTFDEISRNLQFLH